MKLRKMGSRLLGAGIGCLTGVAMLAPAYAQESENLTAFQNQMGVVSELAFSGEELSVLREPVVYARHLYNQLTEEEAARVSEEDSRLLAVDEAKVLDLWITDLMPLDSFADSGMLWVIDEQYAAISEELDQYGEAIGDYVPHYADIEAFYENEAPKLQAKKREDYAAAIEVEGLIGQINGAEGVSEARQAYDGLTGDQKSFVTNYEVLKKAENDLAAEAGEELPHTNPENIIYSGTRSSVYGPGTPWLSTEEWGSAIEDMKTYFPNSESTMVWIIGSLHESGVNLEFERPEWLTEEWLNEKDYRSLENITFAEPDKEGHEPHETYFDYFDEHGVKVYLQVEAGYSDMRTLMDIVMQMYGDHACVAGFGVDVEWYWGVEEDSGLAITDALAEQWDQHLKSINKDYRLFLKHYNTNYLPQTYRSDIIFVNDSQSFGSMNGDALGQYDENLDDVLGFIPEFKAFADTFAPNDVIYQIGYKPDRMWYYTLEDPVIQSLGEKLAEATSQNCGIVWVDFTLKDVLTFPQLLTEESKLSCLKGLIGYFKDGGSNMVGIRFAAGENTYRDKLFVERVEALINGLTEEEQETLWGMFDEEEQAAVEGYRAALEKIKE